MARQIAINRDTDVTRFARALANEINEKWKFSANVVRANEEEWKVITKHSNGFEYNVRLTNRNNVLSLGVEEAGKSIAKNILGSLAALAIGTAIGSQTRLGSGAIYAGAHRNRADSSAQKKLEKIVDNFADKYFIGV